MLIETKISVGELLDKTSILKIKNEKIKDKIKLVEVKKELSYLEEIIKKNNLLSDNMFIELFNSLIEINKTLWDIEDEIRKKEKIKKFDENFVQLARSVYIKNDERFKIKNSINLHFGSEIKEVKSYKEY